MPRLSSSLEAAVGGGWHAREGLAKGRRQQRAAEGRPDASEMTASATTSTCFCPRRANQTGPAAGGGEDAICRWFACPVPLPLPTAAGAGEGEGQD